MSLDSLPAQEAKDEGTLNKCSIVKRLSLQVFRLSVKVFHEIEMLQAFVRDGLPLFGTDGLYGFFVRCDDVRRCSPSTT
jgi:hypothetical protein